MELNLSVKIVQPATRDLSARSQLIFVKQTLVRMVVRANQSSMVISANVQLITQVKIVLKQIKVNASIMVNVAMEPRVLVKITSLLNVITVIEASSAVNIVRK
jgi:hypothetical protein